MIELQEVGFGGLVAREADQRVPFGAALDATNCVVDDDALRGRNGYRAATAGAIGSGTTQGVWRHRPGANARTVVVRGGNIYLVTDPSTESASDGAVSASLGAVFGGSDRVSAAQLGQYLYLGPDSSSVWRRIKPDFTLEAFESISKGAKPTSSFSSALAMTLFVLANVSVAGGAAKAASGITDWINISGTIGGTATWDMGAGGTDWRNIKWLFVACSPESESGGGGKFRIELGNNAGNYASLTDVYDTPGSDSPFGVYCSLSAVDSTIKQTARYIRFTQLGPTTDPFSISGFMQVPSAPGVGDTDYYVTFYNSVTGQESVLTDKLTVTYSASSVVFPTFHAARWHFNTLYDYLPAASTNPDAFDTSGLFNKGAGKAVPVLSDFSPVATISGTSPAGSYDKVRLWRQTAVGQTTGLRLVKEVAQTPGLSYAITDDVGDAALGNQSYKAGGTPPPCVACCAVAGRLLAGGDPSYPNRLSISSFLPFGQSSDTFPQFPAVPYQNADGWQFDLSETAAEQILCLVRGDLAAYILTNEACYVMTQFSGYPTQSIPYKIVERGVIGRRAAVWEEEALFWAAHDGVYVATNRSGWQELSKSIRRLYRTWLIPDSSTVVEYQDRKLYITTSTRQLRYDFVTQTWTRHNLAHTFQHGAGWRDPSGTIQQLWYLASNGNLYRWQPGTSETDPNRATTDAGTAIAAWTYSTGFLVDSLKTRIESLYLDTSGSVTAAFYKNTTTSPGISKTFGSSGEHQLKFPPGWTGPAGAVAFKWRMTLTGANVVAVYRAMVGRQGTAASGG